MDELAAGLDDASRELNPGIEEVSRAVSTMDLVTPHIAVNAGQSAQTASTLKPESDNMRQCVE